MCYACFDIEKHDGHNIQILSAESNSLVLSSKCYCGNKSLVGEDMCCKNHKIHDDAFWEEIGKKIDKSFAKRFLNFFRLAF